MLLYKYLGREDFFSNFKLRITPPNELNDPRECIPEIRLKDPRGYISNVVQRNFESGYFRLLFEKPGLTPQQALDACLKASSIIEDDFHTNNDAWIKRIFDTFMNVTNRNVGILSLSETYNNELMWSHYANSHNGYVVGFDAENAFFKPQKNDPKVCGELMNVQYSDSAPLVYVEPEKFEIPKELFFTKTTKWSYEREWRMIKLLTSASEVIGGTIHLFEVPAEAVKEVIFGIKVADKTRENIESLVRSSAPHVVFKNASLNHRGEFHVA